MNTKRRKLHIVLLTAAAAASLSMTACQSADAEYTVMGDSSEVSRVTSEKYTPYFATQQAALVAEEEESASVSDTAGADAEDASEGATAGSQRRTMADDVNLREEPGDGTILEIIPKGGIVELLSGNEDGWYQVRYGEITGYVKEGYFQEDRDREEAAEKKAEEEQQAQEEAQKRQAAEEARQKAVDAAIQKQQAGQDAGDSSASAGGTAGADDSDNAQSTDNASEAGGD